MSAVLKSLDASHALHCNGDVHVQLYPSLTKTLPLPNEDFGRPTQHFRMRFRSTFQRLVAQIVYSHPLHLRTLKTPIFKHLRLGCMKFHLSFLVYSSASPKVTNSDQSAESPILFRSCGHETPFSDQKVASKIGNFSADSVL